MRRSEFAFVLRAAHAFARWRFALSRVLFALLTVPNFVQVSALGLRDTPAALIIPQAASAFAIMILYQAIRSFPEELVDAARMDGGGHLTVLLRAMVPNLRPALASLGILPVLALYLVFQRQIIESFVKSGIR